MWNSYAFSRTTLKMLLILILAVVINFGLVLGFTLTVQYNIPGPVTEETVSGLDEIYDGCTTVYRRHIDHNNLDLWLVKTQDGQTRLVTFQKHYLFERYRVIKNGCMEVPEGTEMVRIKFGANHILVDVVIDETSGNTLLRPNGGMYQAASRAFRDSTIISIAALCALELIVWCTVFRKEEIA